LEQDIVIRLESEYPGYAEAIGLDKDTEVPYNVFGHLVIIEVCNS
jgi:hypothetical protein